MSAQIPDGALSAVSRLVSTVRTVYRGPAIAVEHAVVCLLSRGHLLIEDVPGVGKTTLAMALGKALGLGVHRLQFTPDTLPSDILGLTIFNQQTQAFDFHPGRSSRRSSSPTRSTARRRRRKLPCWRP